MKRLFIAIKILADEDLLEVLKDIQSMEKQIKWVDTDNLHLTLEFLGNISDNKIPLLKTILYSVTIKKSVFNLELYGINTFRKHNVPTIIWIGVKNCEELIFVQNEIHNILTDAGFKVENRNYSPHITLGRVKKIERIDFFNRFINNNSNTYFGLHQVKSLVLFESILLANGPVYRELYSGNLHMPTFK